ncbi:MAG: hypothetical protein AAB425_03505, partial [Bdellovibrionota bacterium]
ANIISASRNKLDAKLAVDDTYLCALTDSASTDAKIYCGSKDGSGMKEVSLSESEGGPGNDSVRHLSLSGSRLYIVTYTNKIYYMGTNNIGNTSTTWNEIVGFSSSNSYSTGAVKGFATQLSDAGYELYVALENEVLTCSLTSVSSTDCASWESIAGSSTKGGYYRATAKKSWLYQISALDVIGDYLYIVDEYGVSLMSLASKIKSSGSKIKKTTTRLEQWLGKGADRIFGNNLSARSLFLSTGKKAFATNGDVSLLVANVNLYNVSRASIYYDRIISIDHTVSPTSKTYCGKDEIAYDTEKVFRLYKNADFGATFSTAVGAVSGLSSSTYESLSQMHWLGLSTSGCTSSGYTRSELKVENSVVITLPTRISEKCRFGDSTTDSKSKKIFDPSKYKSKSSRMNLFKKLRK